MASDRGLPSLPRTLDRELRIYLQALGGIVQRLSGNVRGSEQVRAVRAAEGGTGGSVGQGTVSSWNLTTNAVSTEKMIDGCVTEKKLADKAVTGAKIAQGAVETTHFKVGSVTRDKLAERSIDGMRLAGNSVSAEHLGKGAVTKEAIAGKAVDDSALADGAVGGRALAAGAVTEQKIAAGAVGASAIKNGAVTLQKLEDGLLPIFLSGEAADGETVIVPGTWHDGPVVSLVAFSLPLVDGATLRVGAESLEPDAAGVWSFTAVARTVTLDAEKKEVVASAGTLKWAATGRKKSEAKA